MYIHLLVGIHLVLFSNIIHNNSQPLGVVFVTGEGYTKMMYCIFQNNQNTLFKIDSGIL